MADIPKVEEDLKLASGDIQPEQVVRDFLDALSSLESTHKPLVCSSPEQSDPDGATNRPGEGETAVEDAEGSGSAAIWASALSKAASKAISAPDDTSTDDSPDSRDVLMRFCLDDELIERMQITPQEIDALSQSLLLGSLTSEQDVLFMLRTIRQCVSSAGKDTTGPVYFEMAENIRRDSLRRLIESDSTAAVVRRRVWGLFVPSGLFVGGLTLMITRTLWPIESVNRFVELALGCGLLLALGTYLRYPGMRRS